MLASLVILQKAWKRKSKHYSRALRDHKRCGWGVLLLQQVVGQGFGVKAYALDPTPDLKPNLELETRT